jgi:hypothetical protein
VLRVKSVAPISLSSAATTREADGWESLSSRAAREKLPERDLTARKVDSEVGLAARHAQVPDSLGWE